MPYLSVIIPAYNEENRITKTLKDIDKYLKSQSFSYEIVVVNDASTDKTVEVVQNLMDSIDNLRILDYQKNHGKGWSVKKGMLETKGDYRLFMDADNATTLDHFDKMRPLLEKDYKIIIGTRDSKDHKDAEQTVSQPWHKRMLGDVGNILIQVMAVPGIWDTQCGFKLFSAQAATEIFKRSKIDRWGFDIEALALARKLGYKIGIIPVKWVNDPNSHVGLKGYVRTLLDLLKIKWNFIKGAYDLKKK